MQSSMVGELEVDVEIKTPAHKYYHMLTGRPQDLPKVTPDNIKRCDVLEGEPGEVGSILFFNYVVDGQPKVAKKRIEALEPEKNLMVARIIDGDLMQEFKSFLITVQATPMQRGPGSVVKCQMKYERIDEKVADPENLLAAFVKASKDMDKMLSSEV